MDKQHELEQLFNAAKNQPTEYSFDEAQQSFMAEIKASTVESTSAKKSILSFKNWIIMLSITSAIALTLFINLSNEKDVKSPLIVSPKNAIKTNKNHQNSVAQPLAFQSSIGKEMMQHVSYYENFADSIIPFHESTPNYGMEAELERYLQTNITLPYFIDEYRFPNLTEKEIAANNKQKKVMLKALEKFDKKVYTHLVSGSFDYQGKLTSVQSFLIQKTEVSNLEYRTFLYDLLIQGRKDDFLIAKPEQKNWSQISGLENTAFEESYFTHEAFNNYPVVNISREGAELFCKWLSQEVDKILDDKKKELFNDIRLPMREEWVMAASIEGKKGPYCWEGEKTTNSSGCYLANYKPLEGSDSTSYKADGGFYTVRVDSYFPNDFGLYNMNGNVAEMVYNDIKTKAAGTAGGAWNSNDEEIKILGPDPYAGVTTANPAIGFRVVMTMK
jgi:formylglycine-generating enzyme required for sulfatase activity